MKYVSYYSIPIFLFSLVFLGNVALFSPLFADTATTTDIQSKIEDRNAQIKKLEDEINQYNLEVSNAQKTGATLKSTLNTLNLTKKKITTDITLTQQKISKADLTIQKLNNDIGTTQTGIETSKKAVTAALQNIQFMQDIGIVPTALAHKNISEIWNAINNSKQIEQVLQNNSKQLAKLKANMELTQTSLGSQKKGLLNLKQDLTGKELAVASTASEQQTLLNQTKNKESVFQQLVKTKQQEKAQFEKDVNDFEAQLNITINKNAYPAAEHSILSWPLEIAPTQSPCDSGHKVVSCIVRGFFRPIGNNGVVIDPGHNGVDFRASTGTKVQSVLDGVVAGTGNTDIYKGCFGLGKWVMVNHPNGLSSIYMHLSVVSVTIGQNIKTGDLVGYSGNTGNSEAPHLHVSIYATEGVRIEQFVNSIGCKQAVVPLADPKAYLDPLQYFPAI